MSAHELVIYLFPPSSFPVVTLSGRSRVGTFGRVNGKEKRDEGMGKKKKKEAFFPPFAQTAPAAAPRAPLFSFFPFFFFSYADVRHATSERTREGVQSMLYPLFPFFSFSFSRVVEEREKESAGEGRRPFFSPFFLFFPSSPGAAERGTRSKRSREGRGRG